MATRRWERMPKSGGLAYRSLVVQGYAVRKSYPAFRVKVSGERLRCEGNVCPTSHSNKYRIRIDYHYGSSPRVRIVTPVVEPRPEIHMYRDGTLCLYDWREQPWLKSYRLHDTLMPWIAEWLLYYEAFLLTGRWLGPEAPHDGEKRISA